MASCITHFNHFSNETERTLSGGAVLPFIGTGSAICKFALGTVQTITALVLGILSAPFRFCSDNAAAFNDHCWSHVVHGLGNIAASLIEAIPFAGTFLYYQRAVGHTHDNAEHQDKYIPYPDLIARDTTKPVRLLKATYKNQPLPNPPALSPTKFRAYIQSNVVRGI